MRFVITPTALFIAAMWLAASAGTVVAGQTLAVGGRTSPILQTSDCVKTSSTTIDCEQSAIDDAGNAAALDDVGHLAFQVPEPPPWLLVTIVIAAYLFRRRSREDRS